MKTNCSRLLAFSLAATMALGSASTALAVGEEPISLSPNATLYLVNEETNCGEVLDKDTVPYGSTLFLSLEGEAVESGDKKVVTHYKAFADWKIGSSLVEDLDIEYKKVSDPATGSSQYRYVVALTLAKSDSSKAADLAGTIRVGKTASSAKQTEGFSLNLTVGTEAPSNAPDVYLSPDSQLYLWDADAAMGLPLSPDGAIPSGSRIFITLDGKEIQEGKTVKTCKAFPDWKAGSNLVENLGIKYKKVSDSTGSSQYQYVVVLNLKEDVPSGKVADLVGDIAVGRTSTAAKKAAEEGYSYPLNLEIQGEESAQGCYVSKDSKFYIANGKGYGRKNGKDRFSLQEIPLRDLKKYANKEFYVELQGGKAGSEKAFFFSESGAPQSMKIETVSGADYLCLNLGKNNRLSGEIAIADSLAEAKLLDSDHVLPLSLQ